MQISSSEVRGTLQIPEAKHSLPVTGRAELESALSVLESKKEEWVALDLDARIALLEQLITSVRDVSQAWVSDALKAKGITPGTATEGEEWLGGPYATIRNLRLLARSLRSLRDTGKIALPAPARTLPNGQVAAPVFPTDFYDKLTATGFSAEIWMEPGVTLQTLSDTQGVAYQKKQKGKVALVLGAGNVSSIGPMDVLYKLFVEDQVCVLKMNPVNEYVGPHIEQGFAALVAAGYLRVVYGGAAEGELLCRHPAVDEIHITGSDKTHDAIVYGTGDEGARNKSARRPLNTKRVTSELGNVSPVIVVPGPWSDGDLKFQAENLASMLTNNAGFNCNATRVIITHAGWSQRESLIEHVGKIFEQVPARTPYYPGARARYDAFVKEHPNARRFGDDQAGKVPWTLVSQVAPDSASDICFTTEAFCAVTSETALPAASVVEYIERAVKLCNETVWGTLNASIIVHPKSLRDPAVAQAVEHAIEQLRYGTIVINHWAGLGYGFVSTAWGAYPGHVDHDIRSGRGVVHNTYMFDRVQKTVIRGPFRISPKPPWFATNRVTHKMGPRLVALEAGPSIGRLCKVALQALRG